MRAVTRIIFVDNDGERFFGEGPYRLLVGIEETGSLRRSADRMGMAYSKALRLLKNAERALGFPLTEREVGGKNGGGSRLTKKGREWLALYEGYTSACRESCARLYDEFFCDSAL